MKKVILWALMAFAVTAEAQTVGPVINRPIQGSGGGGSTTLTAGTTATSGCTNGGFLYSLSSLIQCGTAVTTAGTPSGSSTTSNFLNVTGTLPAVMSASTSGVRFDITGRTYDQDQNGLVVNMSSAVTTNYGSTAGYFSNSSTGYTNVGVTGLVSGATGSNLGVLGMSSAGNTRRFGGLFTLGSGFPSGFASLAAENGTSGLDIFNLYNNGSLVFKTANGGATTIGSSALGTSVVPLTVTPGTGSTANIQNWTDSAGTVLSRVSASGKMYLPLGNDASPSYSFTTATNAGFYEGYGGIFGVANGVATVFIYTNEFRLDSVTPITWSATGISSTDTSISREGAGRVQLGLDVNGAAVNQTLKAHDGITGTNIAGADLTFAGGRGTGTGEGGDLRDQTAVPVASGTTAQTLGDRTAVLAKYTTLTEATATAFARVNIPTSTVAGGDIVVTVEANDTTDFQARTLTIPWSAANKAGTLTLGLGATTEAIAASAGTLTCTITFVDATSGNADFKADCTSSLTQTVLRANAQVRKNFGTGAISAQ